MPGSPTASRADSTADSSLGVLSCVFAALAAAILLSLPFLSVRFPPITDLPQQAAQVRLASEALSEGSQYRFNLLAPGSLGYGLFAVSWLVTGAENAGRIAYLLLGWLWIGALALLIRRQARHPELIPLATLFFFSHALYWGFLSFLFGAVVFLAWIILEERLRRRPASRSEPLILGLGGLVLYASHALWFAAGVLWLGVVTAVSPLPTRRGWLRLAGLVPALGLALLWLPSMKQSDFHSETAWRTMPWARLAPGEWVDSAFGGLQGPVEPVILGVIAVWLVLGLLEHRDQLGRRIAPTFLLLGTLMLVASLLLPDHLQNTLGFARRWTPIGMALLVIALPPPRIRQGLRWAVAFVLLATLTVATTASWKRFERFELEGLEASLAALPDEPRLLGLDFYRLSQVVKTYPFFQNAAYGQVLKGGSLGFSFASFPTSPVVFRQWENPSWALGLEWLPSQIFERTDDFFYFDYALIHTDPTGHAYFEQQEMLESVTGSARWRLYRVIQSVARSESSVEPASDPRPVTL